MKTTTLFLDNIKCHGCANSISKAINELLPNSTVNVDPPTGKVDIASDSNIEKDTVLARLKKMGYAETGESTLTDKAKSYVSCMIGRIN